MTKKNISWDMYPKVIIKKKKITNDRVLTTGAFKGLTFNARLMTEKKKKRQINDVLFCRFLLMLLQ